MTPFANVSTSDYPLSNNMTVTRTMGVSSLYVKGISPTHLLSPWCRYTGLAEHRLTGYCSAPQDSWEKVALSSR